MKKLTAAKRMQRLHIWVIAAALLVLAVAVIAYARMNGRTGSTGDSVFSGTVTSVDSPCLDDDACTLVVDGKTVIIDCGFTFEETDCPHGGNTYRNIAVGDNIKVNANHTTGGRYNLHCDRCGISKR